MHAQCKGFGDQGAAWDGSASVPEKQGQSGKMPAVAKR